MTRRPATGGLLRLCLDLNVWCAALIASRRGRTGSSSVALVEAVRRGECPLGPVQLVVSWGMLDRLRQVYVDALAIDPVDAEINLRAIAGMARLGPAGDAPHLLLGGTGVMPIHDAEDAHVLEVALAGRADIVATANLDDFMVRQSDVLLRGRIGLHRSPAGHAVIIAHPDQVAGWLRRRTFPQISALQRLYRSRNE